MTYRSLKPRLFGERLHYKSEVGIFLKNFQFFLIYFVCSFFCARASVIIPIANTTSPKGVFVALSSSPAGGVYEFIDSKSKKPIGEVLGSDWAMRDNINMVIKWNDAGDKAVLLVSYGTKGDAVFIYEQRPTGRFERLKFSPPNPLSLYKKKTGHALAEADMPGEDQDGLGHWLNDHEITMLSGLSKDTLKPGTDSIGLFATYNASIVDCKVVCSDIILVGPLPQNKWISFVDKWTHSNK